MHLRMADWYLFRSAEVQAWIKECNEVDSGSTTQNFDNLLELSSKRYHSNYYAEWLDRLSSQTPSDHPDKEPLLSAVAYHRDSLFRADLIKTRNEVVQRVLASRDIGDPLLSKVFKSQDNFKYDSGDDSDFAALYKKFHHDHLRLQEITQNLEHYCGEVKKYCVNFGALLTSFELFMSLHPGPPEETVSKWTLFAGSFYHSLKEDRIPDSYVRRHESPSQQARCAEENASESRKR